MAAPTATLLHDALLPRPPGGLAPGAALALLAHAGLLLALTQATDWRTQTPDVVSAELWASVPQVAAPAPEPPPPPVAEPAPPPPPAPPPAPAQAEPPPRADADIAFERAEKRKAELEKKRQADEARKAVEQKAQAQRQAESARQQQQAEAERATKAEQKRREEARELLADEARLAEQREANLRRMMGQAGPAGTGAPGSRGTAAQDAAPSAAYSGRLVALIRANTVFTGRVPDTAVAEVEVRAAASGIVLSRRLLKSSGQADWDEAVLRAIDRTGRLPRDTDGRVPPLIIIAFKPRD